MILKRDVTLNDRVLIANLPDENEDCKQFGKTMVASGWGVDATGNPPFVKRNKLWTVKQQCLKDSKCNGYPGKTFNGEIMICVGDKKQPRNSACGGDSGGKNMLLFLMGIEIYYFILNYFRMSQNMQVEFYVLFGPIVHFQVL